MNLYGGGEEEIDLFKSVRRDISSAQGGSDYFRLDCRRFFTFGANEVGEQNRFGLRPPGIIRRHFRQFSQLGQTRKETFQSLSKASRFFFLYLVCLFSSIVPALPTTFGN